MVLKEILERIIEHGLSVEGVRTSKEGFEKVEWIPGVAEPGGEIGVSILKIIPPIALQAVHSVGVVNSLLI